MSTFSDASTLVPPVAERGDSSRDAQARLSSPACTAMSDAAGLPSSPTSSCPAARPGRQSADCTSRTARPFDEIVEASHGDAQEDTQWMSWRLARFIIGLLSRTDALHAVRHNKRVSVTLTTFQILLFVLPSIAGTLLVVFQVLGYFAAARQSTQAPAVQAVPPEMVALSKESIVQLANPLANALHNVTNACSSNGVSIMLRYQRHPMFHADQVKARVNPACKRAITKAQTRYSELGIARDHLKGQIFKTGAVSNTANRSSLRDWCVTLPGRPAQTSSGSWCQPTSISYESKTSDLQSGTILHPLNTVFILVVMVCLLVVYCRRFRRFDSFTVQGEPLDHSTTSSSIHSEESHQSLAEIDSVQVSSSIALASDNQHARHRGRRQAKLSKVWEAAYKGAESYVLDLIDINPDFDINAVDPKSEHGSILAAAARGGHEALVA